MMVHTIGRPIDLPANIRLGQKLFVKYKQVFWPSLIFASRVGAYNSGAS